MAEIYMKTTFMKKVLAFIAVVVFLSACSRSVTPFDAANKNYKRCHSIR
jgi:PBP1b-binding outer membrane lipoprotein LpoB